MTGADVLEVMVGCKDGRTEWSARSIADMLDDAGKLNAVWEDGRTVAPIMERLRRADLVESRLVGRRLKTKRWFLTARGREVDGIIAKHTHARGGRPHPNGLTGAGLENLEPFAVR